jgi:hypothetical protein
MWDVDDQGARKIITLAHCFVFGIINSVVEPKQAKKAVIEVLEAITAGIQRVFEPLIRGIQTL